MIIKFKEENKAKVLQILYNNAKPQGLGYLSYDYFDMSEDEARKILETQSYFDYLKGRVMKIDLSKNEVDTGLYDRDNGDNKAYKLLKENNLIDKT